MPFVCGARNLGEALRRIAEGAAMIRTKGEAGSGNIVEAVRHIRTIVKDMKQLTVLGKEELMAEAKKESTPFSEVRLKAILTELRLAAGNSFMGKSADLAGYLHFFWAGIAKHVQTGAFFPSQKVLAQAMIAPVPRSYTGLVLELGSGTGSLTRSPGGEMSARQNSGVRAEPGIGRRYPPQPVPSRSERPSASASPPG